MRKSLARIEIRDNVKNNIWGLFTYIWRKKNQIDISSLIGAKEGRLAFRSERLRHRDGALQGQAATESVLSFVVGTRY